jgi:hypothetical protein
MLWPIRGAFEKLQIVPMQGGRVEPFWRCLLPSVPLLLLS